MRVLRGAKTVPARSGCRGAGSWEPAFLSGSKLIFVVLALYLVEKVLFSQFFGKKVNFFCCSYRARVSVGTPRALSPCIHLLYMHGVAGIWQLPAPCIRLPRMKGMQRPQHAEKFLEIWRFSAFLCVNAHDKRNCFWYTCGLRRSLRTRRPLLFLYLGHATARLPHFYPAAVPCVVRRRA